jgi:hypothetical protein
VRDDAGPGTARDGRRREAAAVAWATERMARVRGARDDNRWVEVALRVVERDNRAAGGVLGGGLAYRMFFWTLALTVLAAGGLGFASSRTVEGRSRDLSVNEEVARTIADAAQQSATGRWWLLATGIGLVVWFAWSLLRALRLVHATAWGVPAGSAFPRPVRLLGILAVPVALIGVSAVTGLVRALLGPFSGIGAFVAGSALVVVLMALGTSRLPTPPGVPWTAHLPGALAFVVVLQGITLFAHLYLADKLASSEALYGALGLAATLLFALYLLARGLVWAFQLNAVVWAVTAERDGRGAAATAPPAAP